MKASGPQMVARRVLGYSVLVFFALVFIAPFIITLVTSFKTDSDSTLNPLSPIPHPVTLSAWDQIFGIGSTASVTDVPRWLFNSAFVALMITLARVVLDSLAGYALARLEFRGRKLIFGFIVATMAVPGVVLLIPQFLVLKQLHLFNSYPGMIIPIAADAVGIFLMRQFFLQVPVALEEGGPYRRGEHVADLLEHRAAGGPAWAHYPYHHLVPGIVEPVPVLPDRDYLHPSTTRSLRGWPTW